MQRATYRILCTPYWEPLEILWKIYTLDLEHKTMTYQNTRVLWKRKHFSRRLHNGSGSARFYLVGQIPSHWNALVLALFKLKTRVYRPIVWQNARKEKTPSIYFWWNKISLLSCSVNTRLSASNDKAQRWCRNSVRSRPEQNTSTVKGTNVNET